MNESFSAKYVRFAYRGRWTIGSGAQAAAGQPKRRGTPKSARTRSEILDAAAAHFVEHGYPSTSLEAIARSIGMRQGSLYYYFRTKESLAEEVLVTGLDNVERTIRSALAALPDDAGFAERVGAAIRAHVSSLLSDDHFSRATVRIYYQVPEEVRDRQRPGRERYTAWWLRLVESGVESGDVRADVDPRLARTLLLGAMNSVMDWYNPGRGPAGPIADALTAFVLAGIGTAPRDSV